MGCREQSSPVNRIDIFSGFVFLLAKTQSALQCSLGTVSSQKESDQINLKTIITKLLAKLKRLNCQLFCGSKTA